MFTRSADRLTLRASACVLVLFLVRVAVALTSVPPWQNPDEPQHVIAIWLTRTGDASADHVTRMEGEILESMRRHRWWELAGATPPDPAPARFSDDPELVNRHVAMPRNDGLYYALAAALPSGSSAEDVLVTARRLSAAAGLGVIVLGIATGRGLLGAWGGVGVGTVLALHPQFLLVATTASADAFIALLSSAAIWLAVVALSSPRPLAWLAAAAVPTFAAVLSRRLGVTVLPIACWAAAVVVAARGRHGAVRLGLASVALLLAAGAGVAWWQAAEVRQLAADAVMLWGERQEEFDVWTGLAGLHRSAWMTAGWLRFGPPEFWHVTAGLLVAAAVVGLAAVVAAPREDWARAAVALACGAAALQVGALLVRQFLAGEVSQGRYLAPVAVPLALLLWLGTVEAVPARWKRAAAAVLLLWLAAFDASSWAQVIWPAFW